MNSARERKTNSYLDIEWSVANGKLNARTTQGNVLSIKNLSGSITIDGETFSLKDARIDSYKEDILADGARICVVEFLFEDCGIAWIWEITGTGNCLDLTATLKNNSGKNIVVSDWRILQAQEKTGGIVDLGKKPEQVRFFRWLPWDIQIERFSKSKNLYNSDTICHLYDPSSGSTFLAGFITLDRMQSRHSMRYTEASGITEYEAVCFFGKHKLSQDRELRSETLRISYHDDPYAALEFWADHVHNIYKPSFDGTVGVCANGMAWIDAFTGEDPWSKILLETALAIREKLKGFDIKCLTAGTHQVLKGGLPGNWLTFEKAKGYEGGYEELFKKLREMGFCFKLWFSPFWFMGEADGILEENRENLLRDENGKPVTEETSWEFDRNYDPDDNPYLTKYYLDGTHPGTEEYITKIFKAYRAMGARAYMLDFLAIPAGAKMYDETLLPLEAARKILKVIRDAAESDTHLQTAVASTPGFIGCVNAARVVRDYGEGRPMHPFHNWRNATYCMHDCHFSNEHSFVQNAAASWFTHRKIYINDLNSLTIDKPVPLEQARISTTMFGLSGDSPMILGDDMRSIDPERLRMLKMCLPRTKGVPKPVDLFENVAPENHCRIIKKRIETEWDSYMIVAVFNADEAPYRADINFVKLGLAENETFRVFDFWNEEYAGTYRSLYSCIIPPHACRVYRMSPSRCHPWLLSTDMHIEQGVAEINSLEWNESNMALKGIATRPTGEKGNLFFLAPRQLKLINHDKANIMKEVIDMQTVIRLPLEFKNDKEAFELCFEVMETPFVARKGWLPYATEEEWLEYVNAHRKQGDARVIE